MYSAHSAVNGHIQLHDAACGYCDNITLVSGREENDLWWKNGGPDGSKRGSEDDSWERSDDQKERDKNWRRHVFVDFQYIKQNCISMTKHKILIPCTVLSYKIQEINVYVTAIRNRLLQWSRVIFEVLILFQFYDMPPCIAHCKVFIDTLKNRIIYYIRYISHDYLNFCSAKLS